jgi:FkbM family methyltransferase
VSAVGESRGRLRRLVDEHRKDPFWSFPAWTRGRTLDDLGARPLFIVGRGFGERTFFQRGAAGQLNIEAHVDASIEELVVDAGMWHLAYPLAHRIGLDGGASAPSILGAPRAAAVRATAAVTGTKLQYGARRISTDAWLDQAKRRPGSLSILVSQGPEMRRLRRLAADAGIEALSVSEALRTPSFSSLSNGQFNDLLGDIPARIEELLALESVLDDERSVSVLHAALAYRLTLDPRQIDPVVDHPWREYFASGLFDLHEREVLYDVGAFIGDTLGRFLDASGGRYARAVCLEPDEKNFFFLKKNVAAMSVADRDRVVCRRLGVWNGVTTLEFLATGDTGSRIDALNDQIEHKVSIPVTTLDALSAELGAPTFVKCDAEGADRQVLEGGRRTFAQHRSRVAVSAYHLPDDLITLTAELRAANPDYRLALRQYFPGHWDTVLYAY